MFRPPRHGWIFVTFCGECRDVSRGTISPYVLQIQLLPVTELALCAPLIIPITNRQISPPHREIIFPPSCLTSHPWLRGHRGGCLSNLWHGAWAGELRVNTGEARELSVKYSLATLNLTSVNHLVPSYCPQILGLMIERIIARHYVSLHWVRFPKSCLIKGLWNSFHWIWIIFYNLSRIINRNDDRLSKWGS